MARGDMVALVESVGPDEFDRITVDLAPLGWVEQTFARIGRTVIAISPASGVAILVYTDDETAAMEYGQQLERIRAMAAGLETAREQGPEAMVNALMAALPGADDGEATVPIPAAPYRAPVPGMYEVSATSPPTGLYL